MLAYLEYIPDYLREIKELQGIGVAFDPEVQALEATARKIYRNQFLDDMDIPTIVRWEQILSLPGTGTPDERRFAIAAKRIRYLLFNKASLREMLISLCGIDGFSLEVVHAKYLLRVRVALESRNNFGVVTSLLNELKPATLLLDVQLMFNPHDVLARFTHRQLAKYTHKQLREERFRFNRHVELEQLKHEQMSGYKHFQLMMEELIP